MQTQQPGELDSSCLENHRIILENNMYNRRFCLSPLFNIQSGTFLSDYNNSHLSYMQNTFILSSKIYHYIISSSPGISTKSRISSSQVKVQMRLLRIKSASTQLFSSGNLWAEETNYQSLLYSTCNDEASVYFDAPIRNYKKWDVHRSHWSIIIVKCSQLHTAVLWLGPSPSPLKWFSTV